VYEYSTNCSPPVVGIVMCMNTVEWQSLLVGSLSCVYEYSTITVTGHPGSRESCGMNTVQATSPDTGSRESCRMNTV
jgi:hypothetical protein